MYNYLEQKQILLPLIGKDDFFDYSDSPYSNVFEFFFQHFQKALSERYKDRILSSALFYWHNHTSFNARAITKHNIIGINCSFLILLYSDFNDLDSKLTDYYTQEQIQAQEIFKNDFTPKFLITQFCMLYLFYHELGHILQEIPNDLNQLNEQYQERAFDKRYHVLEFDADIFSAEQLAIHIFEYWKEDCASNDIRQLEVLLSIALSKARRISSTILITLILTLIDNTSA